MKKLALLLVLLAVVAVPLPVFADEIKVISDSSDKISILSDMTVDTKINGTVVAVLGGLIVNSDVNGDVVAVVGDVVVNARVSGQVVAVFGKVRLTENANVVGDVISVGSIEKQAGARVNGQEVAVNMGFLSYANTVFIVLCAAFSFFTLVIGFISVALIKERFQNISMGSQYGFGRRFVIGFIVYVGSTLFLPLLSITVIAPLVYVVFLIFAEIAVSIFIGRLLLRSMNTGVNSLLEFFTGFVLITVAKLILAILMPQMGFVAGIAIYLLLGLLINSLGIGILIDTKFGSAGMGKSKKESASVSPADSLVNKVAGSDFSTQDETHKNHE
jgi:hypothetical protein